MSKIAYKGNILFSRTKDEITSLDGGYIIVDGGKIIEVTDKISDTITVKDFGNSLIIPGFVDTHVHAPQSSIMGIGMDKELISWLNEYAFPAESKFSDIEYADKVYSAFVRSLLSLGTTSSIIFATIHKDASLLLAEKMNDAGLRSFIGKVNMDRNVFIKELQEDTEQSLLDTESFISGMKKYDLLKAIITPRFVPTCSDDLMIGLGQLAIKNGLPVQSHINESVAEIAWVTKDLYPEKTYAQVYDEFGLFGQTPTIMAHSIYSSPQELALMEKRGVMISNCADSNFNLASGMMQHREIFNRNIDVGMGSDVGAGHSLFIGRSIVATMQASKMLWLKGKNHTMLSFSEAFYLATKGGGKFFGKVGSFEPGYVFDALVVDDSHDILAQDLSPKDRLQRFVYTGDDRHIEKVYVNGQELFYN